MTALIKIIRDIQMTRSSATATDSLYASGRSWNCSTAEAVPVLLLFFVACLLTF
ncbi:hypothetical protein RO1_41260 [Roseburia intestinalis XB6B4]|uniref:Uncharacterized protein n=1 Tax=Roseburia intestinalis XB6B4 TaxID=718255 RepID=D4L3W8_9FIRM|nr:hypothetical protein RO1_41260 [Roseburia intestinalis XB6B4]